jgi:hypothetical protein
MAQVANKGLGWSRKMHLVESGTTVINTTKRNLLV